MSGLAFSLPRKSSDASISRATADLIIASSVITAFAMGTLRFKCAVVQAVVNAGHPVGELTVDELVLLIQREQQR